MGIAVTSNGKRYNKYTVIFNEKFIPGEEHNDVNSVVLDIFGESVEDVIKKAWQTVTLTPEQFAIVFVEDSCCYRPEIYSRRGYRD